MADEKKLIIDEDWKAQVEAEKERAAHAHQQPAKQDGDLKAEDIDDVPMPPASFEMLLTTLATEALMALGQLPHPVTGKAQQRPQQAKYLIDTIDVLREKTKGNLTPDEEQAIEGLLHQLRLAFIQVASK